jgi:hypothetical protein
MSVPDQPTNTVASLYTFVQWMRRRVSANLALNSHSI